MDSKDKKHRSLETILVLVAALIIFFWIYEKKVFLLAALLLAFIAMTSDLLTDLISRAWFRLSELLGKVMSKVILSLVYFVVLLPAALLFRLTGKDQLQLNRKGDSYFYRRDHQYTKKDIENIW